MKLKIIINVIQMSLSTTLSNKSIDKVSILANEKFHKSKSKHFQYGTNISNTVQFNIEEI